MLRDKICKIDKKLHDNNVSLVLRTKASNIENMELFHMCKVLSLLHVDLEIE